MGFVSYLEDITTKFQRSFRDLDLLLEDTQTAQEPDLKQLRSDLSALKTQVHGLLTTLENRVLELMTDPTFDTFGTLQDVMFEKKKLEADRTYLSGHLEAKDKEMTLFKQEKDREAHTLKGTLQRSKRELAQVENMTLETMSQVETKELEIKQLNVELAKLRLHKNAQEVEIDRLNRYNEKLKLERDAAIEINAKREHETRKTNKKR